MKKIISLALVLVMAMAVLTACGGTELVAPSGIYSSDSGTYKAEFTGYDAAANSGTLTIKFTFAGIETTVTGTFSVAVNDPEENSFIIDFTPADGTLIENFGGYLANDNAFVQLVDLPEINGANTTYNFGDVAVD